MLQISMTFFVCFCFVASSLLLAVYLVFDAMANH
uniref:Uncharacterized protein n=1 Tax=Arundo donax TaxID=35708 RepID=A0A0A9AEK4_ARUDO